MPFFATRSIGEALHGGETFEDHGALFRQLVDWVSERQIPGDFTFDREFSSAANSNHITSIRANGASHGPYFGDLKTNRKLEVRGKNIRVDEFAASILREKRRAVRRGDDRQWGFTTTVRLPPVEHPVRILSLWRNRREQRVVKVLVTNRTRWEVHRILKTYRYRWTGTEIFHRDGKQ